VLINCNNLVLSLSPLECVKWFLRVFTYGVVEDDRLCTVSVSSSEPVHIQAQTSTRCGSSGQPWQLEAPAGQRITVSVLDFAPGRPPRSSDGPSHRRCTGRVYGFLVDKTQKTNVSVCETTSAGALSGDTLQGEAQSSFNEGQAAIIATSSNSAELLVVRDEQLANNFLVRVEGTAGIIILSTTVFSFQ